MINVDSLYIKGTLMTITHWVNALFTQTCRPPSCKKCHITEKNTLKEKVRNNLDILLNHWIGPEPLNSIACRDWQCTAMNINKTTPRTAYDGGPQNTMPRQLFPRVGGCITDLSRVSAPVSLNWPILTWAEFGWTIFRWCLRSTDKQAQIFDRNRHPASCVHIAHHIKIWIHFSFGYQSSNNCCNT